MKIIFFCNSLEEGKDGIGDYTKRIAMECKAYNIEVAIVAVNDKYILSTRSGNFDDIPFYRIPSKLSLKLREKELKIIINSNKPIDWISLQFVCYGLNNQGIIRSYIPVFRRLLDGFKVHIMMHELWVAEERNASLKMKLLGKIQKWFIISFLTQIKPEVIHTSIPLYKKILDINNIHAKILSLFSNIKGMPTNIGDFEDKVPSEILNNRGRYLIGCVFGSVYNHSWDMDSLFGALEKEGEESGKKIMVVSIGKISYGNEFWKTLPDKYKNIQFLTLGQQKENFISYWLNHFADFGIVTTPAIIAGKSGSYMAFLEHGVPVFCKKNELSFNFKLSEDLIDSSMTQINDGSEFKLLPGKKSFSQLTNTVQTFIQTLTNIQS